jgi:hypothetical protein
VTDLTTPSPADAATENVNRGLLFSLGAIAAAIVGYAILSGVIGIYGYVTGIVAFAIPLFGSWLYTKGAGTGPKAGRMPWIGIMAAAIVVGALTVVVASAWYAFSRVGGDGGLFASAFWRTVVRAAGNGEVILQVVITLAVGAFGIFAALRDRKKAAVTAAPAASPFGNTATPAASPFETTPDGAPAQVAPPAPGTPVPPVAPPAAPAQPSPGVVLNGEPVDPDKRS